MVAPSGDQAGGPRLDGGTRAPVAQVVVAQCQVPGTSGVCFRDEEYLKKSLKEYSNIYLKKN